LSKKWFFDKIYNEVFVQSFLSLGYFFSYKSLDRGFFESFGPTGVTNILEKTSQNLSYQQTGLPYFHLRQFVFGIFLIFVILSIFYLNLPLELLFLFVFL
jgi:NADH:ubiquinone oxidoreductase subunit 5 (subunit L)/multisubunit Na+/H+ antiporter MnhA subunit